MPDVKTEGRARNLVNPKSLVSLLSVPLVMNVIRSRMDLAEASSFRYGAWSKSWQHPRRMWLQLPCPTWKVKFSIKISLAKALFQERLRIVEKEGYPTANLMVRYSFSRTNIHKIKKGLLLCEPVHKES